MADPAERESVELAASDAGELIEAGAELIDVRRPHEFEAGHIPGARHVELNRIQEQASELPEGKPIVLYCRSGNRSAMAAEALRDGGFDAHSLAGGIEAWKQDDRALEPEDGYIAESGRATAILESEGRFPVDKVDPPDATSN